MFERFTEGSRAVVVEAHDLAVELGSRTITSGHLLFGCAQGREETAGQPLHDAAVTGPAIRRLLPRGDEPPAGVIDDDALRTIGIDVSGVRAAVEEQFGPGALEAAPDRRSATTTVRKPRFTPEAKRALELSVRVARELHHDRIAPGHLLLGLVRLDDPFVTMVIDQSDTTVAALSAAVMTALSV